jgi:hypothetical protein
VLQAARYYWKLLRQYDEADSTARGAAQGDTSAGAGAPLRTPSTPRGPTALATPAPAPSAKRVAGGAVYDEKTGAVIGGGGGGGGGGASDGTALSVSAPYAYPQELTDALLFLSTFEKGYGDLRKAEALCTRLLAAGGATKDDAEALMTEIRAKLAKQHR